MLYFPFPLLARCCQIFDNKQPSYPRLGKNEGDLERVLVKDGAYYCYCAYVLRISRYSDFVWVVQSRDICARFNTMQRKQNLASAFGIQKENWG